MYDDVLNEPSPYEILGVAQDADLSAIRSSHRKLALKHHPDRIKDEAAREAGALIFQKVQQAYETLSDPIKRQRYDDQVKIAKLRKQAESKTAEAKRNDVVDQFGGTAPRPPRTPSTRNGRPETRRVPDDEDFKTHSQNYSSWRASKRRLDRTTSGVETRSPLGSDSTGHGTNRQGARGHSNYEYVDTQKHKNSSSHKPRPDSPRPSPRPGPRPEITHQRPSDSDATVSENGRRRSQASRTKQKIDPRLYENSMYGMYSPETEESQTTPNVDERQSTVRTQGTSKYEAVRGAINGLSVLASADTGSDGNFISQRVAADANLKMEQLLTEQRPLFIMAHGRGLRPIGKARAVWRFEGYPDETYDMDFFVLDECIFDVMLGAEFIYRNHLLSSQRHLLEGLARPPEALHVRQVRACGTPRQRLSGHVRHAEHPSAFCSALPDSGAEPNLISYAYAERRGWLPYIEPGPPSCRLLQFADGSLEQTMGRIILHWKFRVPRKKERPPQHTLRRSRKFEELQNRGWAPRRFEASSPFPTMGYFAFDVLHQSPWNMIVGHVFLDETDAFNSMAHCFSALSLTAPMGINPVIWSREKKKKSDKLSTPLPVPLVLPSTYPDVHDQLEALAKRLEEERLSKRRLQSTLPLSSIRSDSLSTKSSVTGNGVSGGTSAAGSIACSS